MNLIHILWLMVWGGMFTGPYNLKSATLFSNPYSFFQGFRAILPIAVVYIILIWILFTRAPFPFSKNPLRFLLGYCAIGLFISFFLSPAVTESLYWAIMYLSPFFVMWALLDGKNTLATLRLLILLNYGIVILITMALFPEVWRGSSITIAHNRMYPLPFNLGEMHSNGVGRFAFVSVVVSAMRFQFHSKKTRFLWLAILVPSLYEMARTQSRTALLGFAVASILFVLMRRADWRLLFVGPLAAYIVWVSGFQWRARGSFDSLINLSGREMTWENAIALIKQSPFLGWGFHADRLLLQSQHMHNSFLHAMIHSGIIGTLFFILAFAAIWILIIKSDLIRRANDIPGGDKILLMESIMILGFMTARGFFESTGAFYGVDLLILVPAMAFIHLWAVNNPQTRA